MIDVVFLRGGDSGGEKVAVEEIFSPSSFLPLAAFLPGFFPTFLTYLQASTPRCRNRINRTRPGFWGCTGEDGSISFKLDVPPLTNALHVTGRLLRPRANNNRVSQRPEPMVCIWVKPGHL